MSNYYISNCCNEQVEIINETEGICGECGEPCELIVVKDK